MIPQVRKLENYSKSTIWVGENLFQNLSKYLDKDFSNCHFITDANVYAYYQDLFPQKNVIVIPAGEASKSFTIIEKIIGELVANNADRHSFLVGVGGGVVCDIAGFVASIYMRGIDFGYVSTTLLSQVDANCRRKTRRSLLLIYIKKLIIYALISLSAAMSVSRPIHLKRTYHNASSVEPSNTTSF
ncbi:MAG: hypothetical protein R2766_01930 [Saprospiraceae bacterium]